jgi:superfamily II DNA helicase RecQ
VRLVGRSAYKRVFLYTADTEETVKTEILDAFTRQDDEGAAVVVATTCFGTGIDCPTVGWVLSLGGSYSILDYVQESGRGGRNGKTSICRVLMHENHTAYLEKQHADVSSRGHLEGAHFSTQPQSFLDYVQASREGRCLRQHMLRVLDGKGSSCIVSTSEPCSNCASILDTDGRGPDTTPDLASAPASPRSDRSDVNSSSFMSLSGKLEIELYLRCTVSPHFF